MRQYWLLYKVTILGKCRLYTAVLKVDFFFSSYLFFISTYPSEFSSESHRAGSPGDEVLGNKVLKKFKEYGMNTWTDEHFIKVQDPPASGFNKFVYKGMEERPEGFLSYSASGTANVTYKLN